jgi:cbb3-type cytochrome oxidase maturation protein
MNSLLILIPVTLLVVLLATAVFFWAVNHQQFDDLDSPGFVPLLEDPPQDDAGPDAPPAARGHRAGFPMRGAAGCASDAGPESHFQGRDPASPSRVAVPPPPISNPESHTTRSIS